MAMNCVQIALDVLESIHYQFPEWKSSLLEDLKVLLRLLRTFYMGGRKWGRGVHCESIMLNIEDIVHKHSLKIQSICLKLRDDEDRVASDTKWNHLSKGVSQFLVCIHQLFWEKMEELYPTFSKATSETCSSSQQVELVGIMDSLLHNLRDLLQYGHIIRLSMGPIEDFQENVRFLMNLILFATSRELDHRQIKDLLTHTQGLVAKATHLTFESWYYDNHETEHKFYPLIHRIKPVEFHVRGIYVGVLEALKLPLSSHHLTPRGHRVMLGDFVDSLHFFIWQLLCSNNSYMNIFNHQIQKLYRELIFLRTILREHQQKFDELYEKMHDLIRVVSCEAGIIICHLFVKENEGHLVKKLEFLFLDLEKKFKLIELEEETQIYPLMSASYFPQTNVLGFINSVLEKLKSIGAYEADSGVLAKDKFQTVHDDLAFLRSFLVDVMVQCDQNGKLQTLRSRIVTVAYETEYVLDSLVVGDALQSSLVLLNTIIEEIKLIKAEASKTSHSKGHIIKVKNIAKTNSKMPLTSEIPVLNELVVGLDDEAQKIINRLKSGTKQLDIASIVGMPGLGKTTMAKKVYNHVSIIRHFHARSWCTVSQVYNKKSLLLEILSGLDNNFSNEHSESNENDLAEVLYKHLKGKRYLIILDDVWDIVVWNSLGSSFPNDANGSRILLTSQHYHVASHIKLDSEPHSLRLLTYDESWELLQKKIGYEGGCPLALLEFGMEIAQLCKGLPLMILIVAGILSNTEQDTWEEVVESLRKGTLSIAEQCMKTLELSYLHLPNHLKPCFLYFGVFGEDIQIPIQQFLWLWIAEGFVEKTEKECLEDVAEGYMLELVQRNLVMVAKKKSTGQVKSCILHDLLLDFCKAKCNEEHFLHCLKGYDLGTSFDPSILYRLQVNSRRVEDFTESWILCPHLRTLLFFVPRYEARCKRYWYDIFCKFWQCKLFRVLDLRGIFLGSFFPIVIEVLAHLRYLALAFSGETFETQTFTFPSSIQKLSNLKTFIVEGYCLQHVRLPDSMWNMKKLRHLYTIGSCRWILPEENPKFRSNLENLETLSTVQFSCGHIMKEVIRMFPNIRRLKCHLDMEEAYTRDCQILELDFMSQLESLTIFHISSSFHHFYFQFPQNLKTLVLGYFCLPWSEISAIDKLPNLEVLKLLDDAFQGEIWDMEERNFPKLRFLKLAGLDFAKWIVSCDNIPYLEKLVLDRCWQLEEVPSSLAYVSTLDIIELSLCESASSSIHQIKTEQMNIGNENLKIHIHPS